MDKGKKGAFVQYIQKCARAGAAQEMISPVINTIDKVFHKIKGEKREKMELYTKLSTLSTILHVEKHVDIHIE